VALVELVVVELVVVVVVVKLAEQLIPVVVEVGLVLVHLDLVDLV
jgi:hypothetical protein